MTQSFLPEHLRQDIRDIRATGFANIFYQLAQEPDHKDELPEEIFELAVKEALRVKNENRIQKLIDTAGFRYPTATIAEIINTDKRGISINDIKRVAETNWRENPLNVHLQAASGTGKSYIACAIGVHACLKGYSVRYYETEKLLSKLAASCPPPHTGEIDTDTEYGKTMRELTNVDLLILDDFCTFTIDLTGQENLSRIIFERDHRLPTMICSQSSAKYWLNSMPNHVNADSLVNRLNTGRHITIGDHDMRKELTNKAIKELDTQS